MNQPSAANRPAAPAAERPVGVAPPADDLLRELVHRAVDAATGLATTESGRVGVRRIATRLAANAVAAADPILPAFARAPVPDGVCTLLPGLGLPLGCGATNEAAAAAALNAAAITVSQCDEGLREARGHPGLHAFAAGLAAAEYEDRSLSDLLHALAVGWEVGARLGLLLGAPRPGVHPHGGWGAAAAAAAAGAAVGLDPAGLVDAVNAALTVGLCGPDASTRDGQNSHYLLPALGTANGLTTAYLVRDGLRPPERALAHFGRLVHEGAPTAASTDAALVARPLLLDAYFKPVGCCAHTLTSWTAARDLAAEITAEDVAEVEVVTYGGAAVLAERRPANRLARQFSIPWAVACGFVGADGADPVSDWLDPADQRGRPERSERFECVSRLAERVVVRHDPALDAGYPAGRPAVVRVWSRTGRRFSAEARFHPGDREVPLGPAELDAVNAGLLAAAGDPRGAADLLRQLAAASGTTPVRRITGLLRNGDPAPIQSPGRK